MKLFLILYDAVGLVAAVSHPLPNEAKCRKMATDILSTTNTILSFKR
jgi:hypothetical protein